MTNPDLILRSVHFTGVCSIDCLLLRLLLVASGPRFSKLS